MIINAYIKTFEEKINFLKNLTSANNIKAKIVRFLLLLIYKITIIILYGENYFLSLLKKIRLKRLQEEKKIVITPHLHPWLMQLNKETSSKNKTVLIIASLTLPQCTKYRVHQKCELFRLLGYNPIVVEWTDTKSCLNALQTSALVIFYRIPASDSVKIIHKEAKRLNLQTVFEVDDLIFDLEAYSQNSNMERLHKTVRNNLLNDALLYQEMIKMCDFSIASTETLALYMQKYTAGEVFIVENCLDSYFFKLVDKIAKNPINSHEDIIFIGYGSGTTTHDVDFEEAAEGVLKILKKYTNVRLIIHGHLQLSEAFDKYKSQVIKIPFMEEDEYYRSVAAFDINIAPLEKSIFNDAKSNIKYLEASIFKVPTIASPRDTFYNIIKNGVNGFLVDTPEEWFNSLEALIKSKELRNKIANAAYTTVNHFYNHKFIAENELDKVIKATIKHSSLNKQKKRIILANILYAPTSFGGATIVTEKLAEQLNKDPDIDVFIFTGLLDPENIDLPEYNLIKYNHNDIPVYAVKTPYAPDAVLEYQNPLMADVFSHVLDAIQPDVVQFHSIQLLSASITEPCDERKIPYSIMLHDCWWICKQQFMINQKGNYCNQIPIDIRNCAAYCVNDSALVFKRDSYLREKMSNATLLQAPCEYHREIYIKNGINPEKIVTNKNGVLKPQSVFNHKIDKNNVKFTFLGGKDATKGFFILKKAFESISKQNNFTLCLADIHGKSNNPQRFAYDWKIKGELIVNAGFDQDSIDEYFSKIDVLICPSLLKESFGLTVREALIRNIWVISTDCGGPVEDIMEGVNGNIIPMNDVDALREAILNILKTPPEFNTEKAPEIRTFEEQAIELKKQLFSLIQE